jgi:putative copper export protein
LGGFEFVGDVLRNDWGDRWIQRQVALAVIVVALLVSRVAQRSGHDSSAADAAWLALVAMVGYQLLVALVSHGNAVPGSFWAVGADFLHLVSSAVWVGMLAMLILFLLYLRKRDDDEASSALQAGHITRFSTIAATSVIVLLATGLINALVQIPSLDALTDTAYGRVLLVKLAVMMGLLAVAGLNAFFLRPRLLGDLEEGLPTGDLRKRLNTSVRIELALGAAVLFAAAVLILHPTSRQLDQVETVADGAQAVVGYEQVQPAGDVPINSLFHPNTEGQNSFAYSSSSEGGDIGDVLSGAPAVKFG